MGDLLRCWRKACQHETQLDGCETVPGRFSSPGNPFEYICPKCGAHNVVEWSRVRHVTDGARSW